MQASGEMEDFWFAQTDKWLPIKMVSRAFLYFFVGPTTGDFVYLLAFSSDRLPVSIMFL